MKFVRIILQVNVHQLTIENIMFLIWRLWCHFMQ